MKYLSTVPSTDFRMGVKTAAMMSALMIAARSDVSPVTVVYRHQRGVQAGDDADERHVHERPVDERSISYSRYRVIAIPETDLTPPP